MTNDSNKAKKDDEIIDLKQKTWKLFKKILEVSYTLDDDDQLKDAIREITKSQDYKDVIAHCYVR